MKFLKQYYHAFLREFRLVTGDMGILIFLFLLPIAYPIVYSLIYNPELVRDVQLVVVDNDRSPLSRELVRRLDATQGTWVIGYAANLQ
ncbi:MAG: ABC transporter permease, partial [Muribaculaceae bacterium]|nr:ABC transporter permease [Muribaculaceae bacterium]